MEYVWAWLRAVGRHWRRELLGGVLIGVLALFSELTGIVVSPKIYEIAAVCLLFYAMFLAWLDEYLKADVLEKADKARREIAAEPMPKSGISVSTLDAAALERYSQALETEQAQKRSQETKERTARQIKEAANGRIAQDYTKGTNLLNQKLTFNEEFETWKSDLDIWRASVRERLNATETVSFNKLFTKHDHWQGQTDALNRVHGDLRGELIVQLERLHGILLRR